MNSRILGPVEAVLIAVIAVLLPLFAMLHGGQGRAPSPAAAGDDPSRLAAAANIDGDRIVHADATPGDWLAYGRTYSEQRFSPLKSIDRGNVKTLGEAWEFRTDTVRGLEATPIVSNGVMFVTGSWSKVVGAGRQDRTPALGLRSAGPGLLGPLCLLRRRQPRRRGVEGRGLCRNPRRTAGQARRRDRQAHLGHQHHRPQPSLHDHRRAARRQRHGADRKRRRPNTACAAISPPTTPTPAASSGVSSSCRAIPRCRRRTPPWKRR